MVEGRRFRTSLAGRSILALALFVGFYVLAIAVAGALCLVPYFGIRFRITGSFYIGFLYLACIGAAGLILWSVIPRPEKFKAPGLCLTPGSDPRLFEEIDRVARETGQKPPREAYLTLGVEAWVGGRGGVMGFGSKRIVGVGLALLEALSANEFRAVLAHEFGHFRRGDTRLGPWIYKTRSTIERTIRQLPALSGLGKIAATVGSLSQGPFVIYGNWFLRVTQAISRHQEYQADAHSAEVAGRDTAVTALRKVVSAGFAFQEFWDNLLSRALDAGFLPAVAAGFGLYSQGHREVLEKALRWQIENVPSDPYDSHPSLGERLKALETLPPGCEPEAAPPAIFLLEDVPRRERELFLFMNPEAGEKLRPLEWDDIGTSVLFPFWAELTKKNQEPLSGVTPKNFPDMLPKLVEKSRPSDPDDGQAPTDDQVKSMIAYVVGVAIVAKLIEGGWQASYSVGQSTVLRLGEKLWTPFKSINELVGGETSDEDWRRLCDEMGIGDLELGRSRPAQAVEAAAEPTVASTAEPAGTSTTEPEAMPATESSGKRRHVSPALLMIFIIALIAGIVGLMGLIPGSRAPLMSTSDDRRGEAPVQPPPGTEFPVAFSLGQHNRDLVASVTRTIFGAGSYEIDGTVFNRGTKTYHFIMVEVELLDSLGKVVATQRTEAQREEYILPGGTRPYKVRGYGKPDWRTARASVAYAVAAD